MGIDVWYDEHNLASGQLMEVVQRELDRRPVFIVILSPHAFASKWMHRETGWACALFDHDPSCVILPVTAQPTEWRKQDISYTLNRIMFYDQLSLVCWKDDVRLRVELCRYANGFYMHCKDITKGETDLSILRNIRSSS